MRRLPRWTLAPLSAGLVLLLLLGAVGAGLRIPGLAYVASLPSFGLLDYRTLSAETFLPLRPGYVDEQLGTSLAAGGTRNSARDAGTLVTPTTATKRDRTTAATESAAVLEHAFTNDDFSKAVTVRRIPFSARTDTTRATREPVEPTDCSSTGGTAWYRYTTVDDRPLVADSFGSDHAVSIAVFEGSDLSALRMHGCSTSPTGDAEVRLTPKAGTTYSFQVAGVVSGGATVFRLRGLGTLTQVSNGTQPLEVNAMQAALSRDGRLVAFEEGGKIWIVDRQSGSRQLISRKPDAPPAIDYSASVSGDGRYVSYSSPAALVPEDRNGVEDLYVHDRATGRTVRASVSSEGKEGTHDPADASRSFGSLSRDGRYLAFSSPLEGLVEDDANYANDIFVRDLRTGVTTLESRNASGRPGNSDSGFPVISTDGRYVTFTSYATNLAKADYSAPAPGGRKNIFRRDRLRGVTAIVSAVGGRADNLAVRSAASSDGTVVSWTSTSSKLVRGDTNGISDAFVRDMRSAEIRRISVSSRGEQQVDSAVSPASDVFQFKFGGRYVAMSGDGRYVAFDSRAGNLVARDENAATDVFLHDRVTGSTIRVSVTTQGEEGNGESGRPRMSYDGQCIAFESGATSFGGSGPADSDVFVYDRNGT